MSKKPSISTETLLDTAMVLQNIQLLTEKTGSPSVRLQANLVNTDNEYFMEQYSEPVYLNEDDIPVHFWERYYDLRDTELSILKAANAYGAFDNFHIQTADEEDPAGLGVILKRPQYYEIIVNPAKFKKYFNVIVALVESRICVTANLYFEGIGTPIVEVDGKKYQFPTIRSTSLLDIVTYCYEKRPSEHVGLAELKEKAHISGVTNLSELIRRSVFGAEKMMLDMFVDHSPNSIMLKPQITISKTLAKTFSYSGKLL